MIHIYINNKSDKTLIMLHGTGGNEHDLISLAKRVNDKYNILSIRGNVLENGMNRYFKRISVGVYDLNSYINETNHLIENIKMFGEKYKFDINKAIGIGFSNGANILLGILQENPILNNYVLLSPDYINSNKGFNNLKNKNIFISTAKDDPYVNYENMKKLINELKKNEANVNVLTTTGHQINLDVLENMKLFVKNINH